MHSLHAAAALVALTLPLAAQSDEEPAPAPRPGPSGGPLLPEQAAIDVTAYRLALTVDPAAQTIRGTLEMDAAVLDDLPRAVLHLDGHLTVDAVRLGDDVVPHRHADGLITVELPEALGRGEVLSLSVDYGGAPRVAPRPPWDGGFTWATTDAGEPWIATSCQGEGGDLWWPCKDHPSDKAESVDLRITVPNGLVVASNGTLQGTLVDGDVTTYHWRTEYPVANYNVALNIAPYEVLETEYTSVNGAVVPVVFYVLPSSAERAREILPQFVDDVRSMEHFCGPYPFGAEKYGIAHTPHLGMEHQTICAYGNRFRPSRFPDYDWLHHHELSHEWWGNLVACRDWKDMWIHEGIGTYMQALHLERLHGRAAYLSEMAAKRRFTLVKPLAPERSMTSREIYFQPDGGSDNDIYNKGSWVMHTLRWTIGDEAFFEGLRSLCQPEGFDVDPRPRFVDTDDVRATFEAAAGRPLDWFFDVYARTPALPELVVERDEYGLTLRWDAPDELPFPMDVPVVIEGETLRIAMHAGTARLTLPAEAEVEVDPESLVLRADDA